jgi:hypothetical protein
MPRTQRSGGSFETPRKESSDSSKSAGGLGISAERELGSTNEVDITGRVKLGIDGLIPQQGIDIEQDVTNNTTKLGVNLGSNQGKIGGNIGIEIGYDEFGNPKVKEIEIGVNIGGFGGEVQVDDEGNTKTSISVAGAKVEVSKNADGSVTLSLCYAIPGGEICVDFKPKTPDEKLPPPAPAPTPITLDPENGIEIPETEQFLWVVCTFRTNYYNAQGAIEAKNESMVSIRNEETELVDGKKLPFEMSTIVKQAGYSEYTIITNKNTLVPKATFLTNTRPDYRFKNESGLQVIYFKTSTNGVFGGFIDKGVNIKKFLERYKENNDEYLSAPNRFIYGNAYTNIYTPIHYVVVGKPLTPPIAYFPNTPNKIKPMPNCCDKIEEIYKYLGVEKLKKRKFKIAKAFLVPQGTGNEECEDFYEIYENLIRMLANGLIINPISKPLGSDFQTPNATAWSSQMYEMMAESMSNGNSSQRFEMHAASQLVQMMKVIAEQSSKIDFLMEAIGFLPNPIAGELPVLFTIHESHKGFGKKPPKEIDISKAKTDDDVEKILGKMFQPSRIPYIKYTFDPNHISIARAISKL